MVRYDDVITDLRTAYDRAERRANLQRRLEVAERQAFLDWYGRGWSSGARGRCRPG
jgi:hypothetical protein